MLSTSDMQSMYFYDMNFTSDVLLLHLISVIPQKIFKAYYGFRVLYVFPFPSAGHWPFVFGSWQTQIQQYILGKIGYEMSFISYYEIWLFRAIFEIID